MNPLRGTAASPVRLVLAGRADSATGSAWCMKAGRAPVPRIFRGGISWRCWAASGARGGVPWMIPPVGVAAALLRRRGSQAAPAAISAIASCPDHSSSAKSTAAHIARVLETLGRVVARQLVGCLEPSQQPPVTRWQPETCASSRAPIGPMSHLACVAPPSTINVEPTT